MFVFACLPLFSLSLFWPPPFSISLSLFLSFVFFLPSCLSFLFCLASWFLCFFFLPCLSSLFLFHEKNNIKIFNHKVFLHQYFLYFGFLSCLLFEILLSYLCFPDFKLCFCSTSSGWSAKSIILKKGSISRRKHSNRQTEKKKKNETSKHKHWNEQGRTQRRETEKGRKKNIQKKHKNQTRGKAAKTFVQASWLSTFHPQWFVFTEGGCKKITKIFVHVVVEFLVVGTKYLFLQCFLKEMIMFFRVSRHKFASQLVVHTLASWLHFLVIFEGFWWTTNWLDGGQPAGLLRCFETDV